MKSRLQDIQTTTQFINVFISGIVVYTKLAELASFICNLRDSFSISLPSCNETLKL